MSYEEAAMKALIDGVREGRKVSLEEAPYVQETLGFKPDVDTLRYMPIEIGPLPPGALGVTHITPNGKAVKMRISPYIAQVGMAIADKYKKSKEWALSFIRNYAKDVTNHEDYHVMSAPVLSGEEITEPVRIAAESVTTRGRYKVKKRLGKHREADFVEATNPAASTYKMAWKLSEIADYAPYEGPSGTGHKGLLADWQREPWYRTSFRFSKAAMRAGFKKIGSYMGGSGVPSYVPARA